MREAALRVEPVGREPELERLRAFPAHLTHAYAKLGVRSRTQLAARLDPSRP